MSMVSMTPASDIVHQVAKCIRPRLTQLSGEARQSKVFRAYLYAYSFQTVYSQLCIYIILQVQRRWPAQGIYLIIVQLHVVCTCTCMLSCVLYPVSIQCSCNVCTLHAHTNTCTCLLWCMQHVHMWLTQHAQQSIIIASIWTTLTIITIWMYNGSRIKVIYVVKTLPEIKVWIWRRISYGLKFSNYQLRFCMYSMTCDTTVELQWALLPVFFFHVSSC